MSGNRRVVVRLVGIAVACAALTAFAALPAAAGASLIRIGSDPYKDLGAQHNTNVEPDSLSFGNTIVTAFQVGRYFNGGAVNIGFATSTDGGATWTHGFLPGTTTVNGGPYDRISDPAVAYDPKHGVWMISTIGIFTNPHPSYPILTDVAVNLSTDGGLTWSDASAIAAGPPGSFYDKNWTSCDTHPSSPHYGNCYTEFDNAGQGDRILNSVSSNGGVSWGPPVPTANTADGIAGQPVAQPNGTVVVPIIGFTATHFTLVSYRSTDGGASWSGTTTISGIHYTHPAAKLRSSIPTPSAEAAADGKIYVAWPDCRFEPNCATNDIVLATSADGLTWSAVSRVPIDPVGSGADHFIPGLAVDASVSGVGDRIAVSYYYYPDGNCTPATCSLNVGYITSADAGVDWANPHHVAGPMNVAWAPWTTQGWMVGDYISTSIVPGADAFPVFAVSHAPTANRLNVAAYTADEPVGGAGVLRAVTGPVIGGPGPAREAVLPTAY